MSHAAKCILVTNDTGLVEHWQRAFRADNPLVISRFNDVCNLSATEDTQAWIDLAMPGVPSWADTQWTNILHGQKMKVIAASSNPKDSEAIAALDAGCTAYCHAFSDSRTLAQITQVVDAGHVWIGKSLMQRLIHSAGNVNAQTPVVTTDWADELTQREREVSVLAANGASNLAIAQDCHISERTVKAHLSAVFTKLNITDRLQLALRVHGIN